MSKFEKLVDRFLSRPKDFHWDELVTLLNGFNYQLISAGQTGGSRMRFIHSDYPSIFLHKPHPGKILRRYQLDYITDLLRQEDLL